MSCHSSPAADGDLVDGVVSVALVRPGCYEVGQSTQVNPDLGGVDHLLQGGRVVEVAVAGPEVWLGASFLFDFRQCCDNYSGHIPGVCMELKVNNPEYSPPLSFPHGTNLGSCRQLTESGLGSGPLFGISNTLQFMAMYCQSSQGGSAERPLSGSGRSSLRRWIRSDSGKSPENCSIT
ncbi:hypothetical protein EYF80_022599 [Liparis tanakae]|uniref:Uncharacterized protein n=1 Tax=Liparis tanakae TaxID=230148 RepID=A0A4Z2HQX4_9TELE|nr:hypothetical protein EYF80_022599 [Liparis tanakae]